MTVVYGDFNCPYSYLASLRVDALRTAGADVEWRAVEHAPTLPVTGRRLDADGNAEMDAELRAVRELLRPDEEFPVEVPAMLPRTEAAISGYAEAFGAGVGDDVRRLLFDAYWVRGLDIGNPEVLRLLLAAPIKQGDSSAFPLHESGFAVSASRGPITAAAHRRIRAWRADWHELGTHTTPTLVCDNVVHAGIDALVWLAADLPCEERTTSAAA